LRSVLQTPNPYAELEHLIRTPPARRLVYEEVTPESSPRNKTPRLSSSVASDIPDDDLANGATPPLLVREGTAGPHEGQLTAAGQE